MAIWQYDFHLLPRARIAAEFGCIPSELSTELEWLREDQGGIHSSVEGHLYQPAVFRGDQSGNWWTLLVLLDAPVRGGETIEAAVTPIVDEVASSLLQVGKDFELKEGLHTIALGRITRVGSLALHPEERPVEALRRIAFGAKDH